MVENQAQADVLSCHAPKFATNMIPRDVVDLSSGKSIAEFAQEFERAMKKTEEDGHTYDTTDDDSE